MPRNLPADRYVGAARLGLAAAALATVWLVLLPWVGTLAPVREFVRGNEAAGINPSAVYYTEIEGMGAIGERVGSNRLRRDDSTRVR